MYPGSPKTCRGGLTLVELMVVLCIVAVVAGLLVPAVQGARGAAWRAACANNLRQIGLGLHSYHDAQRNFPPGTRVPPDPQAFLTWEARLLPYLEQEALWKQTLADYSRQPNVWVPGSIHPGLRTAIPVFVCPADGRTGGRVEPEGLEVAFTHYVGVAGRTGFSRDGTFFEESRVSLRDISDGTSQTIIVGERPPSADGRFGWWYAGVGQEMDGWADMYLGVEDRRTTFRTPTCPPGPYKFSPGNPEDVCDTFHFWSRHTGGAHFLVADGSVRFLGFDAAPVMQALASRAGGEAMSVP